MIKFANLTACVFRCSQPLDALIRPKPAGFISHRIRSWATLQSFLPLTQQLTVPSAFSLLTFLRLQGLTPRESPPPLLAV